MPRQFLLSMRASLPFISRIRIQGTCERRAFEYLSIILSRGSSEAASKGGKSLLFAHVRSRTSIPLKHFLTVSAMVLLLLAPRRATYFPFISFLLQEKEERKSDWLSRDVYALFVVFPLTSCVTLNRSVSLSGCCSSCFSIR